MGAGAYARAHTHTHPLACATTPTRLRRCRYLVPIGVVSKPTSVALDEELQTSVWEHTEELVRRFVSAKADRQLQELKAAAGF